MNDPRLLLQSSNGNSNLCTVFHLEKEQTQIGRDENADFSIQYPFISRKHAVITRQGETFSIRDAGSKNGTFVNGIQVTDQPVTLKHNDVIAFTPEIEYVFLETNTAETATVNIPSPKNSNPYGVVIEEKSRDVYIDGVLIDPQLGNLEYMFLQKLNEDPGRLYKYDELIRYIYPETNDGNPYVRDIYMDYLKAIKAGVVSKIHKAGIKRTVIKAKSNEGFRLVKAQQGQEN